MDVSRFNRPKVTYAHVRDAPSKDSSLFTQYSFCGITLRIEKSMLSIRIGSKEIVRIDENGLSLWGKYQMH